MQEAIYQKLREQLLSLSKEELIDAMIETQRKLDKCISRENENARINSEIFLQHSQKEKELTRLKEENRVLKEQNRHLTDLVALRTQTVFGRSFERAKDLFDEATYDADTVDPLSEDADEHAGSESTNGNGKKVITFPNQHGNKESKPSSTEKQSSKSSRGRKSPDLSKLPYQTKYLLDIEAMNQKYGEGNWTIAFWRSHDKVERLRPMTYVVTTYVPVIAAGPDHELHSTPYPFDILPKSLVTETLFTDLVYSKYALGLPFWRKLKDYAVDGLYLSEQTVTNWSIRFAADDLNPVYDYLCRFVKAKLYGQCDETTLKVINDGRSPGTKSFVWVHITGELDDGPKAAVFCYEMTRATEHLRRFYGEGSRTAVITSDAYGAYMTYEKEHEGSVRVTGCFMHCRRRFAKSLEVRNLKGVSDEAKQQLPETKAIQLIGEIYNEESKLKDLSPEDRLIQRQNSVREKVDAFFEYVESLDPEDPTLTEKLRDAIGYAKNQKKYLTRFLEDGRIPIDNGACERAIKPFATARRAWLFNKTIKGAKASMIYYTLVQTAEVNGVSPYWYLLYLMTKLPPLCADGRTPDDKTLEAMMPWSKEYKQFEYESKQEQISRHLEPDDERPVAPKKKRAFSATCA